MTMWLFLAVTALFACFLLRIAASPPFRLLACLFAAWAERCRNGPDLV